MATYKMRRGNNSAVLTWGNFGHREWYVEVFVFFVEDGAIFDVSVWQVDAEGRDSMMLGSERTRKWQQSAVVMELHKLCKQAKEQGMDDALDVLMQARHDMFDERVLFVGAK